MRLLTRLSAAVDPLCFSAAGGGSEPLTLERILGSLAPRQPVIGGQTIAEVRLTVVTLSAIDGAHGDSLPFRPMLRRLEGMWPVERALRLWKRARRHMLPAVDLLAGAVATPLERPEPSAGSNPRIRFLGGILDAAGAPHLASRLTRRGIALQAPSPAAIDRLQCPGRWLYGGIWFDHYGHFLLETLTRAWHLADLPGPVVFHRPPERPGGPIAATMKDWQTELVNSLFGTPSRIHFVTSTMEFEELVVAEPGCVLGDRCTTEQADALATIGTRIAAPSPAERDDRKLWLSRSALTRRCVVGERDFETDLAAAGFEVIHPEEMPLAAQIRAFDEARFVAGFTGSAFHTALLASRRRAELVHFARFTAANQKTFELCAAAAGYPYQFHDCFVGFVPAPPARRSAIAADLDVRQDFTAVWRILHDSGV